MATEFKHISVLLEECIDGLMIKPDGIYVDGTLGGGGHSNEILKRLTTGRLVAIDKDEEAIIHSSERLKDYKDKITYIQDDFKNIEEILESLKINQIDGALIDLGVSSYQIDNGERGFSYMQDAPLDMRMNQSQYLTAFNVVNEYSEG
ncbi:MAG: 16S rRNA (cytosine(1402)-N(4))-methyltransferase RsmH, partial [Clostridia bacterium]